MRMVSVNPALSGMERHRYDRFMRKSSAAITLGMGFLILMGAGACSEPGQPEYVGVCEDQNDIRVPDSDCDQDGGGHIIMANRHWGHYPGGTKAPAVGQKGTGKVTPPAGASVGRAPASGGFGTHAGTVSG